MNVKAISTLGFIFVSLITTGCREREKDYKCPENWEELTQCDCDKYDEQFPTIEYDSLLGMYTCAPGYEERKAEQQQKLDEAIVHVTVDECPDDDNKTAPGICGCGIEDKEITLLNRKYIWCGTDYSTCPEEFSKRSEIPVLCGDLCPDDPLKSQPGVCGCGIEDKIVMSEGGSSYWCDNINDLCPKDPHKQSPGLCGCGIPDSITQPENVLCPLREDYLCTCPEDSAPETCEVIESKRGKSPGICGCDAEDTLDAITKIPQCLTEVDFCKDDPNKTTPGKCGCGVPETDSDGDGTPDCIDQCKDDPRKVEPGLCGCNTPDTPENIADNDNDGVVNCQDLCPDEPYKFTTDTCPDDHTSSLYNANECTQIYGNNLCNNIIHTAEQFVQLAKDWNSGKYINMNPDFTSFVLLDDINLADALTDSEAENWRGIGTEERPFAGIFFGEGHIITATHPDNSRMVLGSEFADNIGLFGVVASSAIIENLQLDLSVEGKNNVGMLVGKAESLKAAHISAKGQVVGHNNVGALVGQLKNSQVSKATATDCQLIASGENLGGLIGELDQSRITESFVNINQISPSETQATNFGSLAGHAKNSALITNSYVSGSMVGYKTSGALVGMLTDSSIINTFSKANITCYGAPCGKFVGTVIGESSIINAYAVGTITNKLEQTTSPGPDAPSELPGYHNTACSNDDPTCASMTCDAVPVSLLISEVCGNQATFTALYTGPLASTDAMPIPLGPPSLLSVVQPFNYIGITPYIANSITLRAELNDYINKRNSACASIDTPCLEWQEIDLRVNKTNYKIPGFIISTQSSSIFDNP